MTPEDDLLLSRLLEGDLSEDEVAALLTRMEQEPDLARAWALMQELPAAIAALPPPPFTQAHRRRATARPKPVSLREGLAWAVAAAALLTHLIPGSSSPSPPAPVVEAPVEVVAIRSVAPKAPLFRTGSRSAPSEATPGANQAPPSPTADEGAPR